MEARVNSAGLSPGIYYGQIKVSASNAANSSQSATIIFQLLPANAKPDPIVLPTGLIFFGTDPQNVVITNTRTTAIGFSTSASSDDQAVWFSAAPPAGSVAPGQPLSIAVRPQAGLAPAIRRGKLTITFEDGPPRVIDLLLVPVTSKQAAAMARGNIAAAATDCAVTQVIPVFTTLSDGFRTGASFPGTVEMKVAEVGANCGQLMSEGSITIHPSNGDDDLNLNRLVNLDWHIDWRPSTSGSVTLTARATNRNNITATAQVRGGATEPAEPLPLIKTVENAASSVFGAPLAPGSYVSIRGLNMTASDAGTAPPPGTLPTSLGGISVQLGDVSLPLSYARKDQVNALIPHGVPMATQQFTIHRDAIISAPYMSDMASAQPGIFTIPPGGLGQGAIRVVAPDAPLAAPTASNTGLNSRPVRRGEYVQIYCTGLGAVQNPPPPGTPVFDGSSTTVLTPIVRIGGIAADVTFAGLAPFAVGLYQVNALVPDGVTPGDAVEVVIIQDGRISPTVTIAVQ